MTEWELIDDLLARSGWPDAETIHAAGGWSIEPGVPERAPPGRLPDAGRPLPLQARLGEPRPARPPHAEAARPHAGGRRADAGQPFRLVAAPSRQFLNSTFTEMPTSLKREQRPTALLHPETMAQLGLADGDPSASATSAARWCCTPRAGRASTRPPSSSRASGRTARAEGIGINILLSADPAPPNGGAVIHDTAVWLEPVTASDATSTEAHAGTA